MSKEPTIEEMFSAMGLGNDGKLLKKDLSPAQKAAKKALDEVKRIHDKYHK